jgi:hypothetical protein
MKKVYRRGMYFKHEQDIYVLSVIGKTEQHTPIMALVDIRTGLRFTEGVECMDQNDISSSGMAEIFSDRGNEFKEITVNIEEVISFDEASCIVRSNSAQDISPDSYEKLEDYFKQEAKRRKNEG